jgi:predicted small metal-binding protein
MKVFTCANLEHGCSVVLTALTEARLTELVSIHLREAHGITQLSSEKIAQIQQLFTNRALQDAAAVVDGIFEKYNCEGEPECTWRYIAEAEAILTGKNTVHEEELKAA